MAKWQFVSIGGGICSMVIPHYLEHHPNVNLALLCLGVMLIAIPIILWLMEKLFGYCLVNPFKKINLTHKISNSNRQLANQLNDEDIETLLDGKFLDDNTFLYEKPRISNMSFSVSPSTKLTITLHAPKHSYATVRVELVPFDDLNEPNFIIYISDSTNKERMLTGSVNEFGVLLDNNSSFKIAVTHKKIKDKLLSSKAIIQLISWKKDRL